MVQLNSLFFTVGWREALQDNLLYITSQVTLPLNAFSLSQVDEALPLVY